ncbi:type VII secretion-associated protein [Williamsia deligens]|uniref:Type VII secretion-associated protein n=1 Tax=Williamsia deligens TaxID=321325 RepID=A0ABW3G8B2_9NOCA|nr:type VII secretion-associated protein [Williamsia deligens]MCP2192396.1 type VII secretion-associated protein, Rv3446c family, C-terminal domain-containing protein [Williamsia deligens]
MTHAVDTSPRVGVVVDVAYGRLEASTGSGVRIGSLVAAIDAPSVVVGGRRRSTRDAWASSVAQVLGGTQPASVTVAHPSTWGSRRVDVVLAAVHAVLDDSATTVVDDLPRAALIAATHLESSVQVCVVVEAHDDRVDVHRLHRARDRWRIARTHVLDADVPADSLGDLVDDTVEAILVDGDRDGRVREVLDLLADATPTGRLAAIDRAVLHRFGPRRPARPPAPRPPTPSRGVSRTTLAAALAAAVAAGLVAVIAVVAAVVWTGGGDDAKPTAPAGVTAQIGRVTLTVPSGWNRTSDPADDTGAIGFTSIAAPSDDRRLLVVENSVRADSTPASVATSLRNRLGQRGAASVAEFSATTSYAGREVISYRETPGSGAPIRWYVVVESALQVSIGCQPGSQGQSVDAACAAAVGSVAIAPL